MRVLIGSRSHTLALMALASAVAGLLAAGDGTAATVTAAACGSSGPPPSALRSAVPSATATVIQGVPAYNWYHGCSPTAAASVVAYWDLNGYPNLFDAKGDDVFLTANVRDHISSPAHNAKYDPFPDAPGPAPAPDSIAGFMGTSVDPLRFGTTYLSRIGDGISRYAAHRGYEFAAETRYYLYGDLIESAWSDLTAEIDAQRPLVFYVDSNGDGYGDHSIPVFGYDDRGAVGRYFGFYTTWREDEFVEWWPFQSFAAGARWGVGAATLVSPISPPAPVPGPGPLFLLVSALGLVGSVRVLGRRRAV